MSTESLLDRQRSEIETRMGELEPAISEYNELKSTLGALDRAKGRGTRQRRSSGRVSNRESQFLTVIQENPGITVGGAAEKMGTTPNYLYRIVKELESNGQIRKEGKALHPVQSNGSGQAEQEAVAA